MRREDRAFLCYATEDTDRVGEVHQRMVERSIPTWFDQTDLVAGQPVEDAIAAAIQGSRFFVLFLSRFAVRKIGPEPGFQKRELDSAYQIARDQPLDEFTILPLRLEECAWEDLAVLSHHDLFPPEQALATLDRIGTLVAGNPQDRLPSSERLLGSAAVFIEADDRQRALQVLDRILSSDPRNSEAHHLRGCVFEREGRLDDALREFTLAIDSHPGYALAYANRGQAYCGVGRMSEGLADFDRSIEINPNRPTPYNNRAVQRRRQGDLDGALRDINQAISLAPSYAGAYANRANVYFDRGEIEEMEEDLEHALRLDPHNSQALLARGTLRHSRGDHEAALGDLTELARAAPGFRQAYFHRALVLEDVGDLGGAIDDYDRSLEIEPTAAAYLNKAVVLNKLGRKLEAITAFGQVLELEPDAADARGFLEDTIELCRLASSGLLSEMSGRLRIANVDDPQEIIAACQAALEMGGARGS